MIIQKPVNKYFKGRKYPIKGICIHLADGNAEQVYSTFQNEPKSSHYFVLKSGGIWQFVSENDIAWAQGLVRNPTAKLVLDNPGLNPNEFLISIEHEGYAKDDINSVMYETTAKLVREICLRYGLTIDRDTVIGHREIRNDKLCPGKIDMDKIVNMAAYPKVVNATASTIEEKKISLLQQIVNLYKLLLNLYKGK